MAGIIYGKMVGKNDPMYGKIETPVKMIIERESDLCDKRKSVTKALYNIDTSRRFAETFIGQSDFDIFTETGEGMAGELDSIETTFRKVIEHHTFQKQFAITKEMIEDAVQGIAQQERDKASNFIRAYYKTQNKMAELALINATGKTFNFAKGTYDCTAQDELPLFHKEHPYPTDKLAKFKQSNRYCVKVSAEDFASASAIETMLGALGVQMRNFNDDNGEVMGYNADTIIIPGNMFKLESAVKKALGTERAAGSNFNDINLNYGAWDVIVLNEWHPATPKFMLMSREANKNLHGNNLFNRTKLVVNSWVDNPTGNMLWSGRARFGIGFANWKHILLCEQGENSQCTELTL